MPMLLCLCKNWRAVGKKSSSAHQFQEVPIPDRRGEMDLLIISAVMRRSPGWASEILLLLRKHGCGE